MRHVIHALCGLALLVGAESGAAQTLPFEGRWTTHVENCSLQPPPEAGAPVTITAARLVAPPMMTCDFTSVLPGGMSFRIEATCAALGQIGHEFFTFAVLDQRLHWTWGERTGIFDRCPS